MTPIDVVKTRIQIDPAFKRLGIVSGTRRIVASEGPSALLTGFGPTAVGYLVPGGAGIRIMEEDLFANGWRPGDGSQISHCDLFRSRQCC